MSHGRSNSRLHHPIAKFRSRRCGNWWIIDDTFLDFHTGADHIMIDIAPNATISRGPAVWLPSPDPLPRISPLRSAERRTVAESWRLGTIWTRPRLTSASLLSVI